MSDGLKMGVEHPPVAHRLQNTRKVLYIRSRLPGAAANRFCQLRSGARTQEEIVVRIRPKEVCLPIHAILTVHNDFANLVACFFSMQQC
jgi:hypothetical protein